MPVYFELIDGNSSVDLNGSILKVLRPGTVKIKAMQDGDSNWLSAEPVFIDIPNYEKGAGCKS